MHAIAPYRLNHKLLHEQVSFDIKARILSNEFPKGSFLPNEHELSKEYEVSIGTIRRAVEYLVECDLVERLQGRGTVVTGKCWDNLHKRTDRYCINDQCVFSECTFSELECKTIPAERSIAAALKLPQGSLVHFIRRIRSSLEGIRIYEEIFLSERHFPNLTEATQGHRDVVALARHHAILIGEISEDISVANGSDQINKELEVSLNEPLLHTARITCDRRGDPLEYRFTYAFLNGGSLRNIV